MGGEVVHCCVRVREKYQRDDESAMLPNERNGLTLPRDVRNISPSKVLPTPPSELRNAAGAQASRKRPDQADAEDDAKERRCDEHREIETPDEEADEEDSEGAEHSHGESQRDFRRIRRSHHWHLTMSLSGSRETRTALVTSNREQFIVHDPLQAIVRRNV